MNRQPDSMIGQQLQWKRIAIVSLLVLVSAGIFWTGSRYPSLDEKAIMGGDAHLEDPLAFEASIQIQPSDGLGERIVYTTINWIETNLQGMTFGLIIGTCLLTLIGMIPVRGHRNGFVNTLIGMGVGTPLGVCVNCSAPVAKGMHDGGARLETTLATMFSSPTLNVIVLSMLIAIFPPYMVALKIGLTLVFILLVLPALSRWVFTSERAPTYDDAVCALPPPAVAAGPESLASALTGVVIQLGRNFGYIVIRTVPLMLLAGALGAVVAHLVPLTALIEHEPGLGWLIVVGIVGIFLPVPVAFDVVLAAVLLTAGVPVIYSMTLLFTLGIFSIYPFFIVWTSISRRVALTLALVLAGIGIAAGVAAEAFHQAELRSMMDFLESAP